MTEFLRAPTDPFAERKKLLQEMLTKQDEAPLTPAAGALQGVNKLLSGLLLNRLEGQYQERRNRFYQDSQAVIGALEPGAGPEAVARAFSASQNPDLQEKGQDLLLKAVMEQKAAKYGTNVRFDAENRPYVTSDAGDVKFLDVTQEPEKMKPLNAGDEYVFYGERTGQTGGAPGIPIDVSPNTAYAQSQQNARSAANRAASLQEASILGGALSQQEGYDQIVTKEVAEQEGKDWSATIYPQAKSARRQLDAINTVREHLPNAFTGPGAQARQTVMSAISAGAKALFDQPTFDRVKATQFVEQSLAELRLQGMKELLGTSANMSDRDLQTTAQALGEIGSDPGAITRVMDTLERSARETIQRSNDFVEARVRGGITDFEKRRIDIPEPNRGLLQPQPGGPVQTTAPAADMPLTPEEKAELEDLRWRAGR